MTEFLSSPVWTGISGIVAVISLLFSMYIYLRDKPGLPQGKIHSLESHEPHVYDPVFGGYTQQAPLDPVGETSRI